MRTLAAIFIAEPNGSDIIGQVMVGLLAASR
jgi:hypothetical protein